jgi:hypothetical protein
LQLTTGGESLDNKFKSNTLLEQTHFNTNTKSTENVNHNSIDLDRHLVPRDSPPVVNCESSSDTTLFSSFDLFKASDASLIVTLFRSII